jgi:hypothetical protein
VFGGGGEGAECRSIIFDARPGMATHADDGSCGAQQQQAQQACHSRLQRCCCLLSHDTYGHTTAMMTGCYSMSLCMVCANQWTRLHCIRVG